SGILDAEQLEQTGDGHLAAAVAPQGIAAVDHQLQLTSSQRFDEGAAVSSNSQRLGADPFLQHRFRYSSRNPTDILSALPLGILLQHIVVAVVQNRDSHGANR